MIFILKNKMINTTNHSQNYRSWKQLSIKFTVNLLPVENFGVFRLGCETQIARLRFCVSQGRPKYLAGGPM